MAALQQLQLRADPACQHRDGGQAQQRCCCCRRRRRRATNTAATADWPESKPYAQPGHGEPEGQRSEYVVVVVAAVRGALTVQQVQEGQPHADGADGCAARMQHTHRKARQQAGHHVRVVRGQQRHRQRHGGRGFRPSSFRHVARVKVFLDKFLSTVELS